jgi:uncharacterized protein YbjT (DUF2867 family)
VHDPAKADRVRELGADEAVAGDMRDRASIDAALTGVDAVFHVTPAFAPDSAELGVGMVEAATAAGVDRFVFSGVYHPSLSLVNHASMRPIEEALYRSGLGFTVLQPAMFMQGLAGSWADAVEQGVFAMPRTASTAGTTSSCEASSPARRAPSIAAWANSPRKRPPFQIPRGDT